MSDHKGNIQPQLDLEEHAHIAGVPGKKVFNVDSQGRVVDFLPTNFNLEVNRGNVTGLSFSTFTGETRGLNIVDGEVEMWGLNRPYVFLTSAATLYISSTATGDVGNVFVLLGLDADWNSQFGLAITNGRNSVAVTSLVGGGVSWIRFNSAFQTSETRHLGTAYVSTAASTATGIPDDLDEVKGVAYTEDQRTQNGIFSTATGSNAYFGQINSWVDKGVNLDIRYKIRPFGGVFISNPPLGIYENFWTRDFRFISVVEGGKADIAFTVKTTTNNVGISADSELLIDRLPFL